MLDMGFRDDIEKILSAVPAQRQLFFFSATMPRMIQELIKRYSKDPAWIQIESLAQNAPQVDQVYFEVDRRSKIEALTRLIDVHDFRYGIVFCSTKIMVDDLDEHMHSRGYAVDRLHGDITQTQRNRVMEKFRERKFEFLIATDVAARGLDVDDLEVVFNFDLPNDSEDYTHRIGRTGRAGKSGRAFTFVSGQEIYKLQHMIRYAKLKIRRERLPSLDEVEEARANVFFEKIRSALEAKEFKPHDRMIDRLLDQGYASTDICSALIHLLQSGSTASAGGPKGAPAPAGAKSAPAAREVKPAPEWAPQAAPRKPMARADSTSEAGAGTGAAERPRAGGKPAPVAARSVEQAAQSDEESGAGSSSEAAGGGKRAKFERSSRTGKEPGKVTVFLNVGRKQLVTTADIVGKIAGVTRLPAEVVGAIDIHQRHTLADVAESEADFIVKKLTGIRLKGVELAPARTGADMQT